MYISGMSNTTAVWYLMLASSIINLNHLAFFGGTRSGNRYIGGQEFKENTKPTTWSSNESHASPGWDACFGRYSVDHSYGTLELQLAREENGFCFSTQDTAII